MKVKATQRGYYGGRIIEPDTEFEIASADDMGAWMEPVEPAAQAADEKPAKGKKAE